MDCPFRLRQATGKKTAEYKRKKKKNGGVLSNLFSLRLGLVWDEIEQIPRAATNNNVIAFNKYKKV